MKILKGIAFVAVLILALSLAAIAMEFTPSIERKDGPVVVEGGDGLIVTPVSRIFDGTELHADIKKSLEEAHAELDESSRTQLIENFEQLWAEATGGAPLEHAIVSDIFDVRYESELGTAGEGKAVSFKSTVQGLESDDLFFIITKPDGAETWVAAMHSMDGEAYLTLSGHSRSVYAVVRDNGAPVPTDPDDPVSPPTGVTSPMVCIVAGTLAVVLAAIVALVYRKKERA